MAPAPPPTDSITLTVGGQVFDRWTSMRFATGIEHMSGGFEATVSERWDTGPAPATIGPGVPMTLAIGRDLICTGYVDTYETSYDAKTHRVRIVGRSKTEDLIDCMSEIDGGQFRGYRLDAVARAICQPFGIDVVVMPGTTIDTVFDDCTIERAQTAFAFLERLARLQRVLLTDDPQGRLVLTTAGSTRAAGSLVEGSNILAATATLSFARRFSRYIVRGQHGITQSNPTVMPSVYGIATDKAVTRYRPHITIAENHCTPQMASERADWQMRHAAAEGTIATITTKTFRQPDNTLWQKNQIVHVTSPRLSLDMDLLVGEVTYSLSPTQGRRTVMKLGPRDNWTPDPGEVRVPKNAHKGGHAADFSAALTEKVPGSGTL